MTGRIEARYGGLADRRTMTMSNKPSHTAYIVTEPKEGTDRKAQWHEIGVIWPHRNGNGFDLVIPAGLSGSGRSVCTERKDPPAD